MNFLLVPGAGGAGWYWSRVVAQLVQQGHRAVAIDLPGNNPDAGLPEYVKVIVNAGQGLDELVLVGQSLGGFSVPMAAEVLKPSRIVLLNAMIPLPGESAAEWGEHVGSTEARLRAAEQRGYTTEFDTDVYFLHDVPAEVAEQGAEHERDETERAFTDHSDFTSWAAPVTVLAGRDDRLFPFELQHKVARERLQVEAVPVPGGHLAALSYPAEIAWALVGH